MAAHNFNARQSYEREIKDIYSQVTFGEITAAEATIDTTEPIILESVAIGEIRNGDTFTVEVEAAAANPTDTVLAEFSGTPDAIVCTITPNNGENNPDAAAEAVLNLTADITLTSAAAGAGRNDSTFEIVVNAAAANDDDEVLVTFSGTAEAIVVTVTPNDGTNNTATPVDLTTAQLAEVINTGDVAGYSGTIVLTDASSLRELQTATGGGATALAAGGEGDEVSATFEGGTDIPVDLTTEELVELINDGTVAGKTVTVTDEDSLRVLQTATGGDTEPLAHEGEGDGEVATFAGADDAHSISTDRGVSSIERNDVGDYTITLSRKYAALKYFRATLLDSTAKDLRFQIHTDSVASAGTLRFMCLTGATPTDPADTNILQLKLEVKDSGNSI